jgi:hypothetical protein
VADTPAPAVPCCTSCKGTTYSYRAEKIAGVPGLLVYCKTCGGIFSWSPHVVGDAPKTADSSPV